MPGSPWYGTQRRTTCLDRDCGPQQKDTSAELDVNRTNGASWTSRPRRRLLTQPRVTEPALHNDGRRRRHRPSQVHRLSLEGS
jgi:hypothetical protein